MTCPVCGHLLANHPRGHCWVGNCRCDGHTMQAEPESFPEAVAALVSPLPVFWGSAAYRMSRVRGATPQ